MFATKRSAQIVVVERRDERSGLSCSSGLGLRLGLGPTFPPRSPRRLMLALSSPNLRTTCTCTDAPTDQPTNQTKPICKAQSEEEKAKADALLDVGEDEAEAVQKQLDDEAAAKKKADEAAAAGAAAPAEKAP